MTAVEPWHPSLDAAALRDAIAAADVRASTATVIGYGAMGRQYVAALRTLRVARIRVCARSEASIAPLKGVSGIEVFPGGIERFEEKPEPGELGIVATPTERLVFAAERLATLGFRTVLVEKPVARSAAAIARLAEELARHGVDAVCGCNRLAYPSYHEVAVRAARDGGISSCAYTFTEMVKPDWPQRFSREELARWGVANSLHVIGMAHGLIGPPGEWRGYRSGRLSWHAAGAIFVGAGISAHGIPFSYHADWGSTGRWSVEAHTPAASYRLCPLEKVFRRTTPTGDWDEIAVPTLAPDVKAGFVEQVAAMLDAGLRRRVPLMPIREAAALTRFAEEVFGYTAETSSTT